MRAMIMAPAMEGQVPIAFRRFCVSSAPGEMRLAVTHSSDHAKYFGY